MPISSMLVPVGLDARDEKVLRYACGLRRPVGAARCSSRTAVDASGSRRRSSLPRSTARASGSRRWPRRSMAAARMDIELRVVTGDRIDAHPRARRAGRRRRDLLRHRRASRWSTPCSPARSPSDSSRSGRVRTMTVRYDLLESVDDPRRARRTTSRSRLVVPTDFSAAATRAWLSAFERPAEAIGDAHVAARAPRGLDRGRRAQRRGA